VGVFIRSFKWVMIVSGLLTSTMFYAAFSPVAAQQSIFGEAIDGAVAQIVVRNWGVLIGLIGLMLIYGAFSDTHRRIVLLVAATSKITFIALVLLFGQQFLRFQVGTSVIVDAVIVVLFVAYLVATRKASAGNLRTAV